MAGKREKIHISRSSAWASDRHLEELLSRADLSCSPGLPICAHWEELIEAIRDNQVLIVSGETGSGKTTQIPKVALLAGRGARGRIVCTQPRRVAATSVAARLAEELGGPGSSLVGYRIRFKDRTGPLTRVQYVTDGLLLAELQKDKGLYAYDTVIVDEAHERSLNIDLLLGAIEKILETRKDLKLIITSATLDVERFMEAFPRAPHLEVAGRGFPVEILYVPLDEEDAGVVEQVLFAIEEIRRSDRRGDILVFLPTERDIHEAIKAIRGEYGREVAALPLFGRLAAGDQQRVFRPSMVQKVVVATNVAETSITVPGIRYVVDSGLARISRYNVRSRTKALPVSPISRASADQRAGRAGRTEPGICIRLYSEDDYLQRPEFTPPEILRSNLAEVILRLEALGLGPVESFPFVDPPSPNAIREGYATLRELGALGPRGGLTRLGRVMARFPLDPRISRMLIQARSEGAVKEIAVIAAALSIQDPRERPAEKEREADEAHRALADDSSDFLAYLKIWNAYHREIASGAGKGRLRRFCKEHYLSYNRMREWRDVHDQISAILKEVGDFPVSPKPASYEAVHRSILAGFLGNLAMKREGTKYLGTRGKEVYLFPGSGLYKKRPGWIVAAELVKTRRLYARTVAKVDPGWVEEVAGDLVTYSYSGPHWERQRAEVVAFEKATLWGLTLVEGRPVAFGRIDPERSREIFIREGLVEGRLKGRHRFLVHNARLVEEVRELENRTRRREFLEDPRVLYAFYDRALGKLERCLGSRRPGKGGGRRKGVLIKGEKDLSYAIRLCGDESLYLTREILLRTSPEDSELAQFPGHLEVAGYSLPLTYRFSPGDPADGITVTIPLAILDQLPSQPFEWLVPGLLEEKITALLRGLPRQARRGIVPIPKTARELSSLEPPGGKALLDWLEEVLRKRYRVEVTRDMWPTPDRLSRHLAMRFSIVDPRGREITSGRDLEAIKRELRGVQGSTRETRAFSTLKARWEREVKDIRSYPQDLPEHVPVPGQGPMRSFRARAFPGLSLEEDKVYLRLFLDPGRAMESSRQGLCALLARHLGGELEYLEKNCIPGRFGPGELLFFGGRDAVGKRIFNFLKRELLGHWSSLPAKGELEERLSGLKGNLWETARPLISLCWDSMRLALDVRERLARFGGHGPGRPAGMRERLRRELLAELARLVPEDFPESMRKDMLEHLPRYMKALAIRVERADADPAKDVLKARRIHPYVEFLERARETPDGTPAQSRAEALDEFSFLLEEYRVSVFAPELGTAVPVSEKRLRRCLEGISPGFRILKKTLPYR